jgi:hypothetical protein
MSRAYKIAVKESVATLVCADDEVTSRLEFLPILDKERTGQLLAAELQSRGFTVEGKIAKRVDDGVTIEVDVETGNVSVKAENKANLEFEVEKSMLVEEELLPGFDDSKLRAAAKAEAEAKVADARNQMREELTAKLESAIGGIKSELDDAVRKVTIAALKQRAAEIGQIEEVHENSNELVIKVRV